MSFAIISDIHSNLEALSQTYKYIRKRKDVEDIVILGDLVGYGANPNECIRFCKKISKNIIVGNHDYGAVYPEERLFFNIYAAKAAKWTEDNLEEENCNYLKNLPLTISKNRFLFVHSSPHNPEEWSYILNTWDANFQFGVFDQNICFIGHSHVPAIFAEKNFPENENKKFFFSKDEKYIVNVGSIGQPRDRNPNLSFAIFDENEWSLEYIRLDYNIKRAADKILNAELPSFLAERLYHGH